MGLVFASPPQCRPLNEYKILSNGRGIKGEGFALSISRTHLSPYSASCASPVIGTKRTASSFSRISSPLTFR